MAGLMAPWVLELLFTLIMLQSVYFELTKKGDDILPKGSPVATRLELRGELPSPAGRGAALWRDQAGRRRRYPAYCWGVSGEL
jgi:hypothetical protein